MYKLQVDIHYTCPYPCHSHIKSFYCNYIYVFLFLPGGRSRLPLLAVAAPGLQARFEATMLSLRTIDGLNLVASNEEAATYLKTIAHALQRWEESDAVNVCLDKQPKTPWFNLETGNEDEIVERCLLKVIVFSFPVKPWRCNHKLEWEYMWLFDPEPRRDVVLVCRFMLVARMAWHGSRCSLQHHSSETFPEVSQSWKTVRHCGFSLGEGAHGISRISPFK